MATRSPAYTALAECTPGPGTTASLRARLSSKSFSLLVDSLKIPYEFFFYIGNHVVCEKAALLLLANLYAFYTFSLHSLARPSVQEKGGEHPGLGSGLRRRPSVTYP